jgi:hypothetical protein
MIAVDLWVVYHHVYVEMGKVRPTPRSP